MEIIRDHKGKSIIAFPSDYIVVDIETTGFSPYYDSIIELTALRVINGNVVDKISTLVHEDDTYVNDFITSLTGITQEMTDSAPHIKEILPSFIKFIGESVIVGQNISFDINFLYDRILKYEDKYLINDHIDIARISRKLFPEEKHHRLKEIASRYHINYDNAHRAEKDCLITNVAFQFLYKDVIEQFKDETLFIELFKNKKYSHSKLKAIDIVSTKEEFDEDHPLFHKTCVFTGTLEKMERKEAMKIVVNCGGFVSDNVTKDTNLLILGDYSYCESIKGGKSIKYKKAEEYMLKGYDIKIVPETVFYEMIEENNSKDELYTLISDEYKNNLLQMIDELIKEYRLPSNSIQLNEQTKNKNEGEYLLQIFEEEWPNYSDSSHTKGVFSPILILKEENKGKYEGTIKLVMKGQQFDSIPCPTSTISVTGSNDSKTVRFARTDSSLITYLRKHILFKVSKYTSSNSFACCSKYVECSNAKQCMHENLLYSTGCQYRKHVEKGEIFYGDTTNF